MDTTARRWIAIGGTAGLLLTFVFSPSGVAARADDGAADSDNTAAASNEASGDPTADKSPMIVVEAQLPQGFPEPGPAYQVVLKEYPPYRAARTAKRTGDNAFNRLFEHIQKNNIAMTAPVEMTLAQRDEGREGEEAVADEKVRYREIDMAFVYRDPGLGVVGPADAAGGVEVVDLPGQLVLSLGFFGNADRQRVDDALTMVGRRLAERDDVGAAGAPRLLGYNSPFIPAARRYHEVQVPVVRSEASAEPAAEFPESVD